MSPRIAPASGAQRAIGRLRKRSKTPLAMSWLSIRPVPRVANTTSCTSSPAAHTAGTVRAAARWPRRNVGEQQQEHDRLQAQADQLLHIGPDLQHAAPGEGDRVLHRGRAAAACGSDRRGPTARVAIASSVRPAVQFAVGRLVGRPAAGQCEEDLVQAGLAQREFREHDARVVQPADDPAVAPRRQ